jgi:hypothetical protein
MSKTSYTPQELDLTRSYILLAHAEIEAFCEDLATAKAQSARETYDKFGKVTPSLRRILSYYVGKQRRSWSDVLNPPADIVRSAWQSHLSTIQSNNGVKRADLEKLFYPVGIIEPHFDATWLTQMDLFGSNRGGWAHKSIMGVVNLPDPASEVYAVEKLLKGLSKLDQRMSRMR